MAEITVPIAPLCLTTVLVQALLPAGDKRPINLFDLPRDVVESLLKDLVTNTMARYDDEKQKPKPKTRVTRDAGFEIHRG